MKKIFFLMSIIFIIGIFIINAPAEEIMVLDLDFEEVINEIETYPLEEIQLELIEDMEELELEIVELEDAPAIFAITIPKEKEKYINVHKIVELEKCTIHLYYNTRGGIPADAIFSAREIHSDKYSQQLEDMELSDLFLFEVSLTYNGIDFASDYSYELLIIFNEIMDNDELQVVRLSNNPTKLDFNRTYNYDDSITNISFISQ